jgi:RNA polymerase sigma-70 factor (ECF subfamily)
VEVVERLRRAAEAVRGGAGVEEAFRRLDQELRPRLLRYFGASGIQATDAEDLVQKTLVRVYQGIGGLEHDEKALAWLFVIARNVLRTAFEDRRRRGTSHPLEEDGSVSGGPESSENPERETFTREVWSAIERLPERQRQCLPLLVRDGMSYEEIAATLRLSVNTVRNHLAAARKTLRDLLGEGDTHG